MGYEKNVLKRFRRIGKRRQAHYFQRGVALLAGAESEAFLATQGYVWDTQSDMAMALVGALLALVLLERVHDRQMEMLREPVGEKKTGDWKRERFYLTLL